MDKERKRQISIDVQKKEQFAKIGRQVRAMQRRGETPPVEKMQQYVDLDYWLTKNTFYWHSHFGFMREDQI